MSAQTDPGVPHPAVWFPNWADVLTRAELPASTRQEYRAGIVEYLRFCKRTRQRATIPSARQFMREQESQHRITEALETQWKAGVNWFFRQAHRQPADRGSPAVAPPSAAPAAAATGTAGPVLHGVPTLAAADLGRTEWEARLIRELRGRHYSWRTEQTYRGWAWRFVRWLAPRGQALAAASEAASGCASR